MPAKTICLIAFILFCVNFAVAGDKVYEKKLADGSAIIVERGVVRSFPELIHPDPAASQPSFPPVAPQAENYGHGGPNNRYKGSQYQLFLISADKSTKRELWTREGLVYLGAKDHLPVDLALIVLGCEYKDDTLVVVYYANRMLQADVVIRKPEFNLYLLQQPNTWLYQPASVEAISSIAISGSVPTNDLIITVQSVGSEKPKAFKYYDGNEIIKWVDAEK